MNKNTVQDTALEIPNVLNTLESKIEILHEKIKILEERLYSVSRPYPDAPPPNTGGEIPSCNTKMGQRIDTSVIMVNNAVTQLQNIIDYLEV